MPVALKPRDLHCELSPPQSLSESWLPRIPQLKVNNGHDVDHREAEAGDSGSTVMCKR